MDPVSAIGLAGSIVGIIDVAVKSISALRALQQRWKVADLTISLLISQLTTLKAALSQIKDWISTSLNANYHYQLVMDLGASLESCETLVLFISGQLTQLYWKDSNTLLFESRIHTVLQDKTIKECATHLANQSTALNLLLTALNCRSLSEQCTLLQAKGNRVVLDQVRDDSSSLLYLRDPESFRSSVTAATERSSLLELAFDFDRDLATTRVYHRQWRSLIRRTLLMSRKDKGTSSRIENGHSDRPLSIVNSRVEDHLHVVDIRILVAAQPGGPVGALRDVMSILCEGRYDPEVRRGHIYKVLLTTISSTLDEMAKSSQLLGNPEAWTPPQAVLCQQISTSSANISEELGNALVSAWDDPGVKRCYQNSVESTAHPSATYFLDSIARISSLDYVPSLEDAAVSLIIKNWRFHSLTLPVSMGSQRYNFINWTPRGVLLRMPSEISSRNMADECEALDAILFMADLATYGIDSADGSLVDEWNDPLLRFRRICKLPWLAEKDIILFFLNFEEFSRKPPNAPTPSHAHKDSHVTTADEITKMFVSSNEDESRKIHVFFIDDNVRAKNLEAFENTVERILSKRAMSARVS